MTSRQPPRPSAFVGPALRAYLAACERTSKATLDRSADLTPSKSLARGLIITFWHEASALMPIIWRELSQDFPGKTAALILSQSRDAEMLAPFLDKRGMLTFRGSSSKGGSPFQKGGLHALMAARDHVLSGHVLGIALDGPRGPAKVAQPGVAHLRKHTNADLIHLETRPFPSFRASSWDRMFVPVPFMSVGVSVSSEPQKLDAGCLDSATQEASA